MESTALAPLNEELYLALDRAEKNLPQERNNLRQIKTHYHNYHWHNPDYQGEFLENVDGLAHACYNGIHGQVRIYTAECLTILAADKTERTIDLGHKMGFSDMKHFATEDPIGSSIFIRGLGHFDWRIVPVNSFQEKIPVGAMEVLTSLHTKGVEFDGYGVATPVARPRIEPRPLRDPVFLGRFGPFWVELARWD